MADRTIIFQITDIVSGEVVQFSYDTVTQVITLLDSASHVAGDSPITVTLVSDA